MKETDTLGYESKSMSLPSRELYRATHTPQQIHHTTYILVLENPATTAPASNPVEVR